MKKPDIIKMYNLPEKVVFCKSCTVSNQRPRITFNEKDICSACTFSDFKKDKIDWEHREKELSILCDKYRKNNGEFDVIVPCSGGKDGSFVAHQLKYKYGMNPLAVTWAPLLPTPVGRKNLDNFIDSGFDHILGTSNGKAARKLARLAFIYLGDPFQPFIYGQANFPLQMAVKYNVSLIMYGECGEVEYGGDMDNALTPIRKIENHDRHYFSGLPPEFWLQHGVTQSEINPFLSPKYEDIMKNKTEIHFLGYYKFWDPQENYYYCKENTGFTPNMERSEGTYSKYASLDDRIDGFHYYLGFIKFGIGRATSDAAHEIRDGKIDREEGVALVKKYDSEFPNKYYKDFLDFVSLDESQFEEIIDNWRSDHIWHKENNVWKLNHAVYDE